MHLLGERGARVRYHDPHIPLLPALRSWPHLARLESVPLTAEVLSAHDAVLIATDHSAVDYGLVLERSALIVDTPRRRAVFENSRICSVHSAPRKSVRRRVSPSKSATSASY